MGKPWDLGFGAFLEVGCWNLKLFNPGHADGRSARAVERFCREVEARDHADDCAKGKGDVKRGALAKSAEEVELRGEVKNWSVVIVARWSCLKPGRSGLRAAGPRV